VPIAGRRRLLVSADALTEESSMAGFKASFDLSKQVVILEIPCDKERVQQARPSGKGKMHIIFQQGFCPVPGLNHIEVEVILARRAQYGVDEPVVDIDWIEQARLIN
jgi:hypothetical protein